jgi:hypothetical protein
MHCSVLLSVLLGLGSVIANPISPIDANSPHHASNKRGKSTGMRAVGYYGNWVIFEIKQKAPV